MLVITPYRLNVQEMEPQPSVNCSLKIRRTKRKSVPIVLKTLGEDFEKGTNGCKKPLTKASIYRKDSVHSKYIAASAILRRNVENGTEMRKNVDSVGKDDLAAFKGSPRISCHLRVVSIKGDTKKEEIEDFLKAHSDGKKDVTLILRGLARDFERGTNGRAKDLNQAF